MHVPCTEIPPNIDFIKHATLTFTPCVYEKRSWEADVLMNVVYSLREGNIKTTWHEANNFIKAVDCSSRTFTILSLYLFKLYTLRPFLLSTHRNCELPFLELFIIHIHQLSRWENETYKAWSDCTYVLTGVALTVLMVKANHFQFLLGKGWHKVLKYLARLGFDIWPLKSSSRIIFSTKHIEKKNEFHD